jgi:hypothetical protein
MHGLLWFREVRIPKLIEFWESQAVKSYYQKTVSIEGNCKIRLQIPELSTIYTYMPRKEVLTLHLQVRLYCLSEL